MPYINTDRRQRMKHALPQIDEVKGVGELNYAITKCCIAYLASQPKNYQTMNDIIGALESAKLEFSRRVVAPYEDLAIERNGDVY